MAFITNFKMCDILNTTNKICYDDDINKILKKMSDKYFHIYNRIIINDQDMLNFITSKNNIAFSKYYNGYQILYYDIENVNLHITSQFVINLPIEN